jgi:hypothetical protein
LTGVPSHEETNSPKRPVSLVYQDHPVFEKPSDWNATIWRYVSFTKFVSILDRRELFFSRADKLGDAFEGSFPKYNLLHRSTFYRKDFKEFNDDQMVQEMFESRSTFARNIVRNTFVNCWNMSDHESAALWSLYASNDAGLAIKSTFSSLIGSFKPLKNTDSNVSLDGIFVGMVKYIDYQHEWMPEGNSFSPFVHKRKSFEHEHELRAVVRGLPLTENGADASIELFEHGMGVSVDLDILIGEIRISPLAPRWLEDLVKSVAAKYEIRRPVRRSDLAKDPVY